MPRGQANLPGIQHQQKLTTHKHATITLIYLHTYIHAHVT